MRAFDWKKTAQGCAAHIKAKRSALFHKRRSPASGAPSFHAYFAAFNRSCCAGNWAGRGCSFPLGYIRPWEDPAS